MSRYLLDTCALLWWMDDSPKLGKRARRVIGASGNEIFVSTASLWEIAIKNRRGRLTGVDEYLANFTRLHGDWGFRTVVIEPADAVAAGGLQIDLTDPFDRMLIVQSRRLEARLVTVDDSVRVHADCVW